MIVIKEIRAEETYAIRIEVLRTGIPLPYKFKGDFDEHTFHLGAFKNNKIIAVSSYMKAGNVNFEGTQYQLRGMATLTDEQGKGLGRLMIQKAFLILRKKKIHCLWCNARLKAVKFYKREGFEVFGEAFEIQFVGPHYVMFNYL